MNRGFTLIEVILAMVILSFLSLFTVQSIQRALKTKAKVQGDIDKNAMVRDALRIMERDINMAFNYRDINIALYNMTQAARKQKAQTGTGTTSSKTTGGIPPVTPAPTTALTPDQEQHFAPKVEKIYTQFIGEPQSLDFTSLSNVRMMEESPISQQAEIGYKLKPCRRRSNQEASSQCLWRRVDNYLHDDITRDGQETVLLENVSEFKLRYLGPGRQEEWVDTWITNERGDDQTKNRFPYAVEITIEVKDPKPEAKDKPLRLTTVAAINNPNNPYDASKDGQNQSGEGTAPTDTTGGVPANGQQGGQPTGTPAPSPSTSLGH